jgi:GxxExxY protein
MRAAAISKILALPLTAVPNRGFRCQVVVRVVAFARFSTATHGRCLRFLVLFLVYGLLLSFLHCSCCLPAILLPSPITQITDPKEKMSEYKPDIAVSTSSSSKPTVTFPSNSYAAVIRNSRDFNIELPQMVMSIFDTLGPHERESTYRKCLQVELERAGVQVEMEVEIDCVYKDTVVGHRYANIVVEVAGLKTVIEIKACTDLLPDHSKQLHFYMRALNIRHGYLINFPSDNKFPEMGSMINMVLTSLTGDGNISHLIPRWLDLRPKEVKIVYFKDVYLGGDAEMKKAIKTRKEESIQPPDVAIAKSTGLPCKVCIKNGGRQNCRYHRSSLGVRV